MGNDSGERPATRVEIQAGQGIQVGDCGIQINVFIQNYSAGQDPGANSNIFDHVPESSEEIDYVISRRPQIWEYLLYAGSLQVGLRDERRSDARRGGEVPRPSRLVLPDSRTTLSHVSTRMRELKSITQEVVDCFEPVLLSRAVGEPGRQGEFRLIQHITSRLITAYAKYIDWGESMRAVQVPRPVQRLY
jgi:hypothetical protein